jgi:ABC-type antimicrobial peptide transport system permease subunit
MVTWSEIRRRPTDLVILMLIVALVSGVVLGAAAGGRRTSTVLDRFLDATGTADVTIGVGLPSFASDPDAVQAVADDIARIEGVVRVAPVQAIPAVGLTEQDLALLTGPDDRYWAMLQPRLLSGRRPAPDDPDEVMINEAIAHELSLSIGDVLVVPTFTVEAAEAAVDGQAEVYDGPELQLEVVGVYRDVDSFRVDAPPIGILSPAGAGHIPDVAAFSANFLVEGDVEQLDIAAIFGVVTESVPDGDHWGSLLVEEIGSIDGSFDSIATGLTLFAVIGAVAGMIALGHAVARHVSLSEPVVTVMRTLGASRRGIMMATAMPAMAATFLGVALGAVAAIASSPMFPLSTARPAEVNPGVAVDWPLLTTGSVLTLLGLFSLALASAWRQARPTHGLRPTASTHWARLRRVLPPAGAVGLGWVLDRDRGGRSVRAGPAMVGAILGIAGVLSIAVFTVSQREATDDASRFGWTWDASPDLLTDDPMSVVEVMTNDPRLAAVGALFCDAMEVDGELEDGCTLLVWSGTIELTYLDGRSPLSPDEVALGRRSMAMTDVELGESVLVRGASGARSMVVVGEVVMPGFEHPGRGFVVSNDGLDELSDGFDQDLLLRYQDGAEPAVMEAALMADYPLDFPVYAYPTAPQDLSQLGRIRPTLVALGFFMGVLGVIGLSHYLLLSSRRRTRDLAVLSALGFERSQTRAVVHWQAFTIATVGVLIGAPLGLIIGRRVWIAAIDSIGIVGSPTIPWATLAAVLALALLGAAALAIGLGRRVTHLRTIDSLRVE